jgi:bacillithiol biosynthesis cysteine-adding enzyme BshC
LYNLINVALRVEGKALRIETIHWKENQALTEAYLHQFDQIKEWFEYNPWIVNSIEERVQWLDQNRHMKADREQLYNVLKEYNQKVNSTTEVMEALEQFKRRDALVVVGGQQTGLFSGPLYVIYKAVSIIHEARRLSNQLDRPVLPVFWLAGEDHDLDEVNHIYSLSPQVSIDKIKIQSSFKYRAAISNVPIEASEWEEALELLSQSLMDTEFKPELIDKLRSIADQSTTLTDGFAQCLSWLFGSYGLILMDAHDPKVRQLETDMFEAMLRQHENTRESLIHTKRQLEEQGYTAQADVREDAVNLFIDDPVERKLLVSGQDRFSDKKGERSWTLDELIQIARNQPERLSNNVFTRPIMQEFLFPVLSTVLGPGEIAYWGLLKTAFHQYEMKMPIVWPRWQFTLVEGTIQKFMNKFEVSFEQTVEGLQPHKEAWLKQQDQLNLDEQFSAIKNQFSELYVPIIETVAQINPGLKKLGETNHEKILEQIAFLEKRSIDAFQSQFDSAIRQWERIEYSLVPLEKRQERVYNIFNYLNKYGVGFIDQLMELPLEDPRQHHIVFV